MGTSQSVGATPIIGVSNTLLVQTGLLQWDVTEGSLDSTSLQCDLPYPDSGQLTELKYGWD